MSARRRAETSGSVDLIIDKEQEMPLND